MRCVRCYAEKTSVTDTRVQSEGQVYRRRRCNVCLHRFSTYETAVDDVPADLRTRYLQLRQTLWQVQELLANMNRTEAEEK